MSDINNKSIGVLIVDDSPTTVMVLRGILSNAGYKVLGEVNNGKSLRGAIVRYNPDIICLDYNLPDSNGLDLLSAIKATYPNIAVVMITGNIDLSIEQKAARLGVSAFIRKPFTESNILRRMEQVAHAKQFLAARSKTAEKPKLTMTAVIVDDSSIIRSMLEMILADAGIQVVGQASNGRDALDFVVRFKPHLVCLDIEMPLMDGLEALEQVKQYSPNSKVLMVTGNASKDAVVQAMKQGASGFLVKPPSPRKVLEELAKIFKSS